MSGTLAFDVKEALYQKLLAESGLASLVDDSAIWYGYLGVADQIPRELIWIGEIVWEDEQPAQLGGKKRDEEFSILLTIEVHQPDDTQQQANERVEELMTIVELMLRDPTWSGLPVTSSGIRPRALGEGADPNGRGAILVTEIRVKARK